MKTFRLYSILKIISLIYFIVMLSTLNNTIVNKEKNNRRCHM